MPQYRKKTAKPRRKPMRRRRVYRKGNANGLTALARTNYARMSEVRAYSSPLNTQVVNSISVSLAGLVGSRAYEIAKNYQEFRITRFTIKFMPFADTWGTGGTAAPQLYLYARRDGDRPNDLLAIRLQGINAVPLAKDGNRYLSVKPSVVYSSTEGGDIIKTSPWLNTQKTASAGTTWVPNDTNHYGAILYVNQPATAAGPAPESTPVGTLELELYFEFRRPMETYVGAATSTGSTVIAL